MIIGSGITFNSGFVLVPPTVLPGPPDAPTIGTATPISSSSATVSFTAPAYDGGTTITSYTATSNPGGITGTLNQAGSGTITVSGLSILTNYTFTVTATNAEGTSSPSSESNSIITNGYTLFEFGYNNQGQLGLGNAGSSTARSSPVQVSSSTGWRSIEGGSNHSIAIKPNNSLWAWGFNSAGPLGLNDTVSRSNPVQVGALTNWTKIISGEQFNLAIKSDGTLWAWGANTFGALGTGDAANRSSPVQIGSDSNWASIGAGPYVSLAIKTNGTLWVWGRNNNGQLGDNTVVNKSSPIQLGSDTDWSAASGGGLAASSMTLALKTSGSMWSWGSNLNGQLGQNDVVNRSNPVQVGSLTNWGNITVSATGGALAVKTSNTLWSWGVNTNGELGLSLAPGVAGSNRSSPTQVGTLSNWSTVGTAFTASFSIKTDGTLWSWGRNDYGQLGQGEVIYKSSPVQVGSGSTWATMPKSTGSLNWGAMLTQ
jgi:alpha-tubulin suppressor-like RCC1 family protein